MIKILMIFSFLLQENIYVIVKINGTAVLENMTVIRQLKPGDRLTENDIQNIHFKNNSILRLASQRGTFLLKQNSKLNNPVDSNLSLASELRNELIPTLVTGEMKSRAGRLSNLTEAQTYFSSFKDSMNSMLVIDSFYIDVSKEFFTDTTDFFFFSYMYNNEKINKKISWRTNHNDLQLCFNKNISLIDGKDLNIHHIYNAKLYFLKHADNESILISPLNINYETFTTIKPELSLLTEGLGVDKNNIPSSEQINYINDYFSAYYGRIDNDKIKTLIKQL